MNVREYHQNQMLMFPPLLKDALGDGHPALIVSDVIDSLDIGILERKMSSQGNKAYHPRMMIKILIYAYVIGTFSSRKIHRALQESVAFIYLAAYQKPDFRTISDFRKNHIQELKVLFQQIVHLCRKMGMVSLGHVAIDGSKFKANAADRRTCHANRVEEQIKRLQERDSIIREEANAWMPTRFLKV